MKYIPLTRGYEAIVDDDYESNIKWHISSHGYARGERSSNGKRVRVMLHREIIGAKKGEIVDHINGNPLDNRRSNLRIVTLKQSMQNRGPSKRSASGYRGVYQSSSKKKWVAWNHSTYPAIYLGTFDNKDDAARAYNKMALKTYGSYARLNKVD